MAKKPIDPLEDPPTASSSEEEEEVESSAGEEDDEEASSSDDDESKDPIKPPSSAVTIAVPSKPNVSSSAAAADSGSDAETDSDSDTDRPSNPPLTQGSKKPISAAAAKPKKKATATETEAAKSSAVLALPPAKSGTKRPIESTSKESTNPKRAKKAIVVTGEEEKKIGGGEDSKKPAAFQRLWTEEDEIAVLQGMIDFKEETGKSFYEDTNCYYDFIKKSISFEVSKNQFMDKLRSLKKKYMGKEKPSFNKPHEQKSFKLSKFIWGPDGLGLDTAVKSNGGGGSVSKKKSSSSSSSAKKLDSVKQELSFAAVSPNGKKAVVVVEEKGDKGVSELACGVVVKRGDWFGNSFLVKAIASSGLDEYCVKQRWSSVSEENKKKVEEKMKVLQDKEIEFVTEKTALMSEVMSMICEANKKKA
ncbi:unnamed protein product [Cochlearia groenlandica]